MSPAQVVYPLIAVTEALILYRTRQSRAVNVTAVRVWLITQLVLFCVLEPASFLPTNTYGQIYVAATIISFLADIQLLMSLFLCLELNVRAFGSPRIWALIAAFFGLTVCLAAAVEVPSGARGAIAFWLALQQMLQYLRTAGLIALAIYGWIRASEWPRDLAWTWLAMAAYSLVDAIVTRVQMTAGDCNGPVELVSSAAALAQLMGFWRALSYMPKPLETADLEAVALLQQLSPNR